MFHFERQLALAFGVCLHFAPWRRHVHLDLHLPIGVLTVGTWQHGDADDPLGCCTEPGRWTDDSTSSSPFCPCDYHPHVCRPR